MPVTLVMCVTLYVCNFVIGGLRFTLRDSLRLCYMNYDDASDGPRGANSFEWRRFLTQRQQVGIAAAETEGNFDAIGVTDAKDSSYDHTAGT